MHTTLNTEIPRTFADHLTPNMLLAAARLNGVTALGCPPVVGLDCKILLGSIVDVTAPGVVDRLLELNRERHINLGYMDHPENWIPASRHDIWRRGLFVDTSVTLIRCHFDIVVFQGADLVGWHVH